MGDLEGPGQTGPAQAFRRPGGGLLTEEDHAAGGGLLPAADDIEESGFAGAVGADEAQDLAFRQGKGDVPENGLVPKKFFDLPNL